jgi:hypothetical protein
MLNLQNVTHIYPNGTRALDDPASASVLMVRTNRNAAQRRLNMTYPSRIGTSAEPATGPYDAAWRCDFWTATCRHTARHRTG